ncbi:prepilin-type N-terminal cleavage/methylation domain-containing protein [Streptococcus sp. X16XC17]|uniref:prepilin-type N-terminal cleavage/methylation domain-containing protein n=1 Tax=unclassified Streptococcus TaxID=2608887 RepID=UPI00066FD6CF|nr:MULTISPECIES: prepilin-type N-terminal cleavage/methylation domain-containing protein [unclassified Streptococcus]TCD46602.1 prepilin-type N-terminal cleavage/methylation domain-containing protein [Streptococcus sp. X16XC17]
MLSKLQNIRRNAKKKGFTLVELVVVIIIIAIIAAVALPRIAAFQESARKSRIQSEHRQLVTAIQSRIAQAEDPTTEYENISSIDEFKEYMNIKGSDVISSVEKDKGNAAHVIDGGKLTSTYTNPNGTDKPKSETWTYTFSPKNQ